jgi:hypothetical protein
MPFLYKVALSFKVAVMLLHKASFASITLIPILIKSSVSNE